MKITNVEQAVEVLNALHVYLEEIAAAPVEKEAPKKRKPRAKKKVEPAPESELIPEQMTPVEEFKQLVVGRLAKAGEMIRARGANRFTDLPEAKQTEVLLELRADG
jgi:hypothetical protein